MNRRHIISCDRRACGDFRHIGDGADQACPRSTASHGLAPDGQDRLVDPGSGPVCRCRRESAEALPVQRRPRQHPAAGRTRVKFEMVPFDNKASPQETLTALKQVIDQGIRYVVQGQGSVRRWR